MEVIPGQLYKHYKNQQNYYVIALAKHAEGPDRVMVVYKALYGNCDVWVRSLEDFTTIVPAEEGLVTRFTHVPGYF